MCFVRFRIHRHGAERKRWSKYFGDWNDFLCDGTRNLFTSICCCCCPTNLTVEALIPSINKNIPRECCCFIIFFVALEYIVAVVFFFCRLVVLSRRRLCCFATFSTGFLGLGERYDMSKRRSQLKIHSDLQQQHRKEKQQQQQLGGWKTATKTAWRMNNSNRNSLDDEQQQQKQRKQWQLYKNQKISTTPRKTQKSEYFNQFLFYWDTRQHEIHIWTTRKYVIWNELTKRHFLLLHTIQSST